MPPSLNICNLNKSFGAKTAVSNLNLQAWQGEIIALLGPNGAGKSTLMNMIAGYLAPSSGEIEVLGKNIRNFPLSAKENIGFLPEGSPLYPDMSVRRFLEYIAELRGCSAADVEKSAQTAKISDVMNQKIETLSKGYARRVGFAQSILSDPPVLLLDEPTDGLDPNQKEHMLSLIEAMKKDKTVIISTHLLDEAETIATRIVIISGGVLKADGPLEFILRKHRASSLAEVFKTLTR